MEIFALFSVKNAGFVFFIGATVDLPGEVFSSLGNLRTFLTKSAYFLFYTSFLSNRIFRHSFVATDALGKMPWHGGWIAVAVTIRMPRAEWKEKVK